MSLYHQTIPQLLKMLTNVEGWLTKAEAFCHAQEIPLEDLLSARLYPNMYVLRRQVQRGCSNATLLASRLGNLEYPNAPEPEGSLDDLRATVRAAKSFVERASESSCEGAEDRKMTIPLVDGMEIRGEDMATDFSMPNVYFHFTTAYGILRQLGVPLGKSDFLGPMALVPAA